MISAGGELGARGNNGGHGDDGVGRAMREESGAREGGESGLGFDHGVEGGLVGRRGFTRWSARGRSATWTGARWPPSPVNRGRRKRGVGLGY